MVLYLGDNMPLDASIFYNFAALRNQQNQQLAGQVENALNRAQANRAKGLDLEALATQGVYKAASGMPVSEQETAAIKAYSMMKGGGTEYKPDEFGNVRAYTKPTLWDQLSPQLNQAPTAAAAGTPMGVDIAGLMNLPAMSEADLNAPYPKQANVPLPPMEQGVDMGRIDQARVDNVAKLNQPAPAMEKFLKPGESEMVMDSPWGMKQRGQADIDLEKKRAEIQMGIEAEANKPLSVEQGKIATFADRMQQANDVISNKQVQAAQLSLKERGLGQVPVAGNFLVSKNAQKAVQAERNFINAVLRRESGAVISPEEFTNARQQYFPQPGDTQDVLDQKAANRDAAIQGFVREAGPAYKQGAQKQGEAIDYTEYFK